MRYAIASAASAALVAGMLALCYVMPGRLGAWEASGRALSLPERLLVAGTQSVQAYWFVILPAAVAACFAVCLAVAAALGGKQEGG